MTANSVSRIATAPGQMRAPDPTTSQDLETLDLPSSMCCHLTAGDYDREVDAHGVASAVSRPVGMRRKNSECFIISTFQVLSNCIDFETLKQHLGDPDTDLIRGLHYECCEKKWSFEVAKARLLKAQGEGMDGEVANHFLALLELKCELEMENDPMKPELSLAVFCAVLSQCPELAMFNGDKQEDPVTFLNLLLHNIRRRVLAVSCQCGLCPGIDESNRDNDAKKARNYIDHLFCSTIATDKTCKSCGTTWTKYDNHWSFAPAMPARNDQANLKDLGTNLKDLVTDHLSQRKHDEDQKCPNRKCGKKGIVHVHRPRFSFLPYNLAIQIVRFHDDGTAKRKDRIHLPNYEGLDLGPLSIEPNTPVKYEMVAFLLHHGDDIESGRYKACVRRNQWYSCDERKVQSPDDKDLGGKGKDTSVLVIFRRRDPKSPGINSATLKKTALDFDEPKEVPIKKSSATNKSAGKNNPEGEPSSSVTKGTDQEKASKPPAGTGSLKTSLHSNVKKNKDTLSSEQNQARTQKRKTSQGLSAPQESTGSTPPPNLLQGRKRKADQYLPGDEMKRSKLSHDLPPTQQWTADGSAAKEPQAKRVDELFPPQLISPSHMPPPPPFQNSAPPQDPFQPRGQPVDKASMQQPVSKIVKKMKLSDYTKRRQIEKDIDHLPDKNTHADEATRTASGAPEETTQKGGVENRLSTDTPATQTPVSDSLVDAEPFGCKIPAVDDLLAADIAADKLDKERLKAEQPTTARKPAQISLPRPPSLGGPSLLQVQTLMPDPMSRSPGKQTRGDMAPPPKPATKLIQRTTFTQCLLPTTHVKRSIENVDSEKHLNSKHAVKKAKVDLHKSKEELKNKMTPEHETNGKNFHKFLMENNLTGDPMQYIEEYKRRFESPGAAAEATKPKPSKLVAGNNQLSRSSPCAEKSTNAADSKQKSTQAKTSSTQMKSVIPAECSGMMDGRVTKKDRAPLKEKTNTERNVTRMLEDPPRPTQPKHHIESVDNELSQDSKRPVKKAKVELEKSAGPSSKSSTNQTKSPRPAEKLVAGNTIVNTKLGRVTMDELNAVNERVALLDKTNTENNLARARQDGNDANSKIKSVRTQQARYQRNLADREWRPAPSTDPDDAGGSGQVNSNQNSHPSTLSTNPNNTAGSGQANSGQISRPSAPTGSQNGHSSANDTPSATDRHAGRDDRYAGRDHGRYAGRDDDRRHAGRDDRYARRGRNSNRDRHDPRDRQRSRSPYRGPGNRDTAPRTRSPPPRGPRDSQRARISSRDDAGRDDRPQRRYYDSWRPGGQLHPRR